MIAAAPTDQPVMDTPDAQKLQKTFYLSWSAIGAGALVAAATSFVLISFGAALGLTVASPSSTSPTAATAESLLAFKLDRLFRSEHGPNVSANDPEIRGQAARI